MEYKWEVAEGQAPRCACRYSLRALFSPWREAPAVRSCSCVTLPHLILLAGMNSPLSLSPPPPFLSHSPTFSSPSIRMCNLRGRRDHFCFLPVPLLCSLPLSSSALPLSFSLSLSPALFSLPLATFHTNFKQIFSEPKYCTHRRKSRAVCGSTRYEYIVRENQLEKQLRRKF